MKPSALFTTPEQREKFLDDLVDGDNLDRIKLGVTFAHFAAINLPIWVAMEAILADAAALMSRELVLALEKDDFPETEPWIFDADLIACSVTLKREIEKALAPGRARIEADLDQQNSEPRGVKPVVYTVPRGDALSAIYRQILAELALEHSVRHRARGEALRDFRRSLEGIGVEMIET